MQSRQKRSFQACCRAETWLGSHPAIAARFAPLFAALADVVAALHDAAVQQDLQLRESKAATAEAARLRRLIVEDHMRIITRVARVANPDLVRTTVQLTMPPRKVDPEELYASAFAMAAATEEHHATLVVVGLPADIVPQLRALADEYRAVIGQRGQAVAARRGATESLVVHTKRARTLIDSISPLVQKALRSDPATLAEWKQLKRVTLKGVRAPSIDVPAHSIDNIAL